MSDPIEKLVPGAGASEEDHDRSISAKTRSSLEENLSRHRL